MSLSLSSQTRQPFHAAWSMEHLIIKCSITLGYVVDASTQAVSSSALNSYLTFCQLHHLDSSPTANTLSLYITFMSHHIEPCSVCSYLAGIVSQLQPSYPSVPIPLFMPTGFCLLLSALSRMHCISSLALCARNHPSLEMTSSLSINIFFTHCLMTTCYLSPSCWLVSLACCA